MCECLDTLALHLHPPRYISALQRVSDAWKIHILSSRQVVSDQTPEQEIHGECLGTLFDWAQEKIGRREKKKEEGGGATDGEGGSATCHCLIEGCEGKNNKTEREREMRRGREKDANLHKQRSTNTERLSIRSVMECSGTKTATK